MKQYVLESEKLLFYTITFVYFGFFRSGASLRCCFRNTVNPEGAVRERPSEQQIHNVRDTMKMAKVLSLVSILMVITIMLNSVLNYLGFDYFKYIEYFDLCYFSSFLDPIIYTFTNARLRNLWMMFITKCQLR